MAEGAGELGRRRVYPNSMGLWPHPITPVTPARPLNMCGRTSEKCNGRMSTVYHLTPSLRWHCHECIIVLLYRQLARIRADQNIIH